MWSKSGDQPECNTPQGEEAVLSPSKSHFAVAAFRPPADNPQIAKNAKTPQKTVIAIQPSICLLKSLGSAACPRSHLKNYILSFAKILQAAGRRIKELYHLSPLGLNCLHS